MAFIGGSQSQSFKRNVVLDKAEKWTVNNDTEIYRSPDEYGSTNIPIGVLKKMQLIEVTEIQYLLTPKDNKNQGTIGDAMSGNNYNQTPYAVKHSKGWSIVSSNGKTYLTKSGLSDSIKPSGTSIEAAATKIDPPQKYIVTVDSVWVRSGPSTVSSTITYLKKGDIVEVVGMDSSSSWIKHSSGWSCCNANGSIYITPYYDESQNPTTYNPENVANDEIVNEGILQEDPYMPDLEPFYTETTDFDEDPNNYTIRNAMSILGLPYQFLPNVDTRLVENDGAALGRKYAEKIISRMPLLLLTPGEPKFMARFNEEQKKGVVSLLLNAGASNNDTNGLDAILGKDSGKYYTFRFAFKEYYNYVDPMCRIAAQFLNIGDHILDGTKLHSFSWGDYTRKKINSFAEIGETGAIPVYIDTDDQISESFSNSTGQSMIASSVNGFSDTARELIFLMGMGASVTGIQQDLIDAETKNNAENLQDIFNNLTGKSGFLKNLANNFSTVVSGGKLIFPEIWNDSDFSRSYDINIKLTTPDTDVLSWYFNICVPLIHFIALSCPRSIPNNPNGYTSPFLVRGYYKGLFNCDMGIITSLNINKGQECGWTKEGLPTVVNVSMSIKDLYGNMSISSMEDKSFDTMDNTMLMDYLANLCGININKVEIARQIDMWFVNNVKNRITDSVTKNLWGGIEQSIANKIMSIYRRGM